MDASLFEDLDIDDLDDLDEDGAGAGAGAGGKSIFSGQSFSDDDD